VLRLDWADWQRGAEELREAWGIRAERRAGILLHPGTLSEEPFKRWPATRYARTAEQLARRTSQPIEVHAGPGEWPLVEAVRRLVNGTRESLSGSLDELMSRIAGAAVFIGGDTGAAASRGLGGHARGCGVRSLRS
jgi:ADP-heptose:LPS heptosyltransferase